MERERAWVALLVGMGLVATAVVTSAQSIPTARDQVARPGGQVPGLPALALVKVADGFADPVGVASANDGSGRIFVVERVGRVKIVTKDGRVLPDPFLDLTKTNPLGSEVQTGFVEQGLWSTPRGTPPRRRTAGFAPSGSRPRCWGRSSRPLRS
jgi:hypothetical protein